jgi:hypothetical protein
MNIKHLALLIIGIILTFLGSLWFLQGTGIIHLDPVMCVAECEPITGISPTWTVIGAVTSIVGIVIIVKNRKLRV